MIKMSLIMDYVVYILYSQRCAKTYTGFTSSLIQRFHSHNNSEKGFTTRCRPWTVVHVEFYMTKREAMDRERFLKTGAGREWMRKNLTI